MADSKVVAGSGGGSFLSLLTVLFIGLKLTGFVGWSWWWVLAPMWIPFAIAIVIGLILLSIFWSK